MAVLAGGALALAGEAAVHLQQFAVIFHSVKWVGPLFLANAAACLAVVAGLAFRPTRRLAALAGVGISVVALASLVIAYGQGIFGWQEAGWRPAVAWAMVSEASAVVLLATVLAWPARSASPRR